jgi:hypothetical protein
VLRACLAATDLAGKDSGTLEQERREVELQNLELKRHMSEVVASNGVDKQEAIEELRLEYEEHLREAVEETRQLMEREVKRQKLELEVYTQTLLELRNNLTKEADKNASLVAKTEHLEKCLRENEVSTSDTEKKKVRFEGEEQAAEQERELARRVEEARLQAGQEVEQEWEARVVQARAVWEAGQRAEVEEAVSRARLDWIRRLPEAEEAVGVDHVDRAGGGQGGAPPDTTGPSMRASRPSSAPRSRR